MRDWAATNGKDQDLIKMTNCLKFDDKPASNVQTEIIEAIRMEIRRSRILIPSIGEAMQCNILVPTCFHV